MPETITTDDLHAFVAQIRREALILRAGAGGNRVARQVASDLIALTGGEAAAAFDEQMTRERILASTRKD